MQAGTRFLAAGGARKNNPPTPPPPPANFNPKKQTEKNNAKR